MTRTNRRKRVQRTTGLTRLLRGGGNRRLKNASQKATGSEQVSTTCEAEGGEATKRRVDWRAVGRRAGRLALLAGKVALLACALAATVFGGYHGYRRLAGSTYFDVDTIEVSGARRLSADRVRAMLGASVGRPIFRVDARRLERALDAHPWIRSASVDRRFPRTLEVEIVEQRARAALLLSHLYLVNADGEVFKRAEADEAEAMPVITGIDRATYLKRPDAVQGKVRRVLAAIDEYYRQVRPPLSEVNLGPDGELTLLLRRGGVALRFGKRFGPERLHRLDAVLAALGPGALGQAGASDGPDSNRDTSRRIRAVYLDNEVHPERVVVRTLMD